MTASLDSTAQALEEAAWVHGAALLGLVSPGDLMRWADAWIMRLDAPPYWLIEISTLKSGDPHAYVQLIEPEIRQPLALDGKTGLIAAAYHAGALEIERALGLLHEISWSADDGEDLPNPIWELLMEWDHDLDTGGDFDPRFRSALTGHLQTLAQKPFLIQPPSSC